MTVTVKMIAPGFQAGYTIQAQSQVSYTADANGVITVAAGDVQSLANAGCAIEPQRPVVTLGSSGYIVQGAINIIPSTAASSVLYAYTLAAPAVLGMETTIIQAAQSTAANTITSSGSNIGSTGTVLTNSSAFAVTLIAAGSTQWLVSRAGVLGSSLVTVNPAVS